MYSGYFVKQAGVDLAVWTNVLVRHPFNVGLTLSESVKVLPGVQNDLATLFNFSGPAVADRVQIAPVWFWTLWVHMC